MKKLVFLMLVLGVASMASAVVMKISVDGVVDPTGDIILTAPSGEVTIDIHVTDNTDWPSGGVGGLFIIEGPGTLDIDDLTVWQQSKMVDFEGATYTTYFDYLKANGYPDITDVKDFLVVDSSDPFTEPDGEVIDDIILHCTGTGDVTLTMLDISLNELDTQVIKQVPEPLTVALLGLGGLFLRRRK